jgi:virginiamycin A acetyltransferase
MLDTLKTIARCLATLVVMPAIVSFQIRSLLLGRDRALASSTQALAFIPGIVGQDLRRAFLAQAIDYCAPDATIEFGTLFSKAGTRIDRRAYIGPRCHLGLVHIEQDVLLAAGVHVPSGGAIHGISDVTRPIREQEGTIALVRIGEGSWVGSAAVVMADIGRHSIVGAGSVVTKPVPEFVIAAGVPAKIIRSRKESESTRACERSS